MGGEAVAAAGGAARGEGSSGTATVVWGAAGDEEGKVGPGAAVAEGVLGAEEGDAVRAVEGGGDGGGVGREVEAEWASVEVALRQLCSRESTNDAMA